MITVVLFGAIALLPSGSATFLGPRPPPPFPPYFVATSIEQPCDHFNSLNHDTFRQRYLVNASHWGGPGAPIL